MTAFTGHSRGTQQTAERLSVAAALVSRLAKSERGQSMVEFALVFPLFLALLFGIIDLGYSGYQVACFDYSYMNASWGVAASSMVDYDYESTVTGTVSPAVAATVITEELSQSAAPGFNADNLSVTVNRATLSNTAGDFTVPDRLGAEAEGVSTSRSLAVEAELTYRAQPLVGFSLAPITVHKNLSFDRIVGVEHRAA